MYVRGTTLSLAWYRGNIGHQFFDSLLPLVPFLGKYLVTHAAESDFGVRDSELFSAALALQAHGCPDDASIVCFMLRRLGVLEGRQDAAVTESHRGGALAVPVLPQPPAGVVFCHERLLVPKHRAFTSGFGAAESRLAPMLRALRQALTRAVLGEAAARAPPANLGLAKGPRRRRLLIYSHAASSRRVWLDAGEAAAHARAAGWEGRLEGSHHSNALVTLASGQGLKVESLYVISSRTTDLHYLKHDFGGLSFEQQADAFASADAIVMAHGAQAANAIYARNGTAVVELNCRRYSVLENTLVSSLGHRFALLTQCGRSESDAAENAACITCQAPVDMMSNFSFSGARLEALLANLAPDKAGEAS